MFCSLKGCRNIARGEAPGVCPSSLGRGGGRKNPGRCPRLKFRRPSDFVPMRERIGTKSDKSACRPQRGRRS